MEVRLDLLVFSSLKGLQIRHEACLIFLKPFHPKLS
jgi:hypothetical protein